MRKDGRVSKMRHAQNKLDDQGEIYLLDATPRTITRKRFGQTILNLFKSNKNNTDNIDKTEEQILHEFSLIRGHKRRL